MGLFQSLAVGVAGLKSQASKLGVVSDNISNVNTVGYKQSIAQFESLVHGFSAAGYLAGGVAPGYQQANQKNGIYQPTENFSDLAISGRGFFPVSDVSTDGGDIFYTRAGSFSKNQDGNFINASGYFLKGWRLDENGDVDDALTSSTLTQAASEAALENVNIDNLSDDPIATTIVGLQANLKAGQTALANSNITLVGKLTSTQAALSTTGVDVVMNVNSNEEAYDGSVLAYDPLDELANMAVGRITPNYNKSFTVYDSAGAERTLRVGYLKTASNSWAVEIYAPDNNITPAVGYSQRLVTYGTVTFDSDGAIATISDTLTDPIAIDWDSADATSTITFNFGAVGAEDGIHESTADYSGYFTVSGDYDPTVSTSSMASGAVTPHYTRSVSLTDNTGTARAVTLNFLKTATHVWDVEILANPDTDLASSPTDIDGQIAYGRITFDDDGAIASISSALEVPIAVDWIATTEINHLLFNWGAVGGTNGLQEINQAFTSTPTVALNYAPENNTKNMTSESVTPHFNREINIVDSNGTLRSINFMFLKTGNNTWSIEIAAENADDVTLPSAQIVHGTVIFNGDGTPASFTDSLTETISIPWADGATSSITLDLGTAGAVAGTVGETVFGLKDGLTQLTSSYQVLGTFQNGNVANETAEVNFDADGVVRARYVNGSVREMFKIPLATFISPDRLTPLTSNVFAESHNSGDAKYIEASDDERTELISGALEASNVELSNEMSHMLIAQRAYQSNAKLISVTDDMLQAITQMVN